jgi:predicted permease
LLFSIFLIFLSGYLFKVLKADYSKALIDVVIYISFPALIIYKIYHLEYSPQIWQVFGIGLLTMLIGMSLGFLASKLFRFDRKTTASFLLVTTLGNTSFLGFPMIVSMFGENNLIWAIFFDQITFFGLVIFGSLFVAYGSEKEINIQKMAIDIIKFPPFIALLFALFLRNFDFNIDFIKPIGDSLIFLVTLAVGMKFSFLDVKKNLKLASLGLIIKMFLVPFSIYLFITIFLNIHTPSLQVALIESAMPPMVMASVLAIEARLREDLAISAVGVGILLSFIVIPLYKFLI